MSRSKYWCFTINNPEVSAEQLQAVALAHTDIKYLIFQEEQGEEETRHFQGYIEWRNRKMLSYVKRHFNHRAHYEKRRGTQQEAIDYCRKEDTRIAGPYEYGEPTETNQGKRTDLLAVKESIDEGLRKRELYEDHFCVMSKYRHLYDDYTMTKRPRRTEDLVVILNYGPPGTGKTRFAYDNYGQSEDFWDMPPNNGTLWFDNYDMLLRS